MRKEKTKKITQAMTFIIIMGVVSLFSDMTHEGASSIRGEYLSLLGASASVIGFVSGLGELVGYGLRFVFGRITDKTKKYWFMTILGYFIDVVCVPTLALVNKNGWIWACVLLILERTGKAIKKPAKSTIVSFAASQEGAGKSFAVQEALDQIGAFLGPVMLYFVLKYKQGTTLDKYSAAFAFLTIPAVLTMVLLFFAKKKFPNPENFEPESKKNSKLQEKSFFYSVYRRHKLFRIRIYRFFFSDNACCEQPYVHRQPASSDIRSRDDCRRGVRAVFRKYV
jgi:hypothetical protein